MNKRRYGLYTQRERESERERERERERMEYYSAVKKNVATWMDLQIIILSEVSQKGKINTIRYHLYVESKI